MKRFKNILYVLEASIDKEQNVAEKVSHLAKLNSAKVTIVRIVEESLVESFGKSLSPRFAKLCDIEFSQIADELKLFAQTNLWDDIDISSQVLKGKDFLEIIRHVISREHDLVVKGGKSSIDTDQLAMRLFRKCPCPVWIIQQSVSKKSKRVLAALDATNKHTESIQLNTKIVELASSLAEIEQGEAHYVPDIQCPYSSHAR